MTTEALALEILKVLLPLRPGALPADVAREAVDTATVLQDAAELDLRRRHEQRVARIPPPNAMRGNAEWLE